MPTIPYFTSGNKALINANALCVFCSRELPVTVLSPGIEFFQNILNLNLTLISGWHSSLERKALRMHKPEMLSNIIYFIAQGIDHFKIPSYLQDDFDKAKLMVFSLWKTAKGINRTRSKQRNDYLLQNFRRFLFLYINPDGNLAKLYKQVSTPQNDVFIFDHFTNHQWITEEVIPVSKYNAEVLL